MQHVQQLAAVDPQRPRRDANVRAQVALLNAAGRDLAGDNGAQALGWPVPARRNAKPDNDVDR